MNVFDFCFTLLESKSLEGKLQNPKVIDWSDENSGIDSQVPMIPQRDQQIAFSSTQVKFPKKGRLATDEGKALALHFFANHELLAIELFAWVVLRFPEIDQDERKRILLTLADEQKHFKLYQRRIEELGFKFGDFPVNDFFWRSITKSVSLEQFYSLMSLTFEQANLDFSLHYQRVFSELGDQVSADILKIVYEDEIIHVKRGARYLVSDCEADELWEKYNQTLPEGVTPARAKGMIYDEKGRAEAGLPNSFIEKLKDYQDSFKVTQRKEWK